MDEDGRAILTNFPRRLALHHLSFKGIVTALAFSPSGQHFAVSYGRTIEVWQTPSTPDIQADGELSFAPFVKHHTHVGHHDTITSLTWSSDSRFFLSTSKDLTARIWSLVQEEGFEPTVLSGHREGILSAWFSSDQEAIYTISQDGALFQWGFVPRPVEDEDDEPEEGSERWRVVKRNFFMRGRTKVTSSAFHSSSNLMVVGFADGLFGLYDLPGFNQIHQLSISQTGIDFVTINQTGEWLAFGASKLGQLLVWEWQSESYILKQQGHFDTSNAVAYSPDGQQIVTAADDGKIKLWDVQSGFCMVTFTEHSAAVTACQFAKRGRVLYTASLDGSIRAWDLVRYRNFRTFTAPTRLPFSCLAVDASGEVVCAGSLDSFDVHVWSIQTGQLLDQLAGHEGPITALAFAPGGSLVSGSWDHSIRTWEIFGRSQSSEPFQLQADVLAVAVSPDSKQIAVSTLDGQLTFWSISDATQESNVDGRRDASGGRRLTDRRTAANAAGSKSFNSIIYSVDGSCLLAGGNSKYLCLYDVQSGTLLKKFTVSVNLALDGTQEYLNSRRLTEAGPEGLIDDQGEASDLEDRIDKTLPGATRGDASVRRTRPEIRVSSVAFSPTARSFCAASTEGLLIYSLDNLVQFDPFDLDTDVTPATTIETLAKGDYLHALVMAFRLNETPLIRRVYERIPSGDVQFVVRDIPTVYLARLLRFVAQAADTSPHLEFNLLWLEALFSEHGTYLKEQSGSFAAELRTCQKAIARIQADLARLADNNTYMLEFLLTQPVEGQSLRLNGTNDFSQKGGSETESVSNVDEVEVEGNMDWEEWQGVD